MRGIIRYLSCRKRLKVRAYFQPSVSPLSCGVLPPFRRIFFIRFLPLLLFVRRRRRSSHLICALLKVLRGRALKKVFCSRQYRTLSPALQGLLKPLADIISFSLANHTYCGGGKEAHLAQNLLKYMSRNKNISYLLHQITIKIHLSLISKLKFKISSCQTKYAPAARMESSS